MLPTWKIVLLGGASGGLMLASTLALLPYLVSQPQIVSQPSTLPIRPLQNTQNHNDVGWEFTGKETSPITKDAESLTPTSQWELEHYRAYRYLYDDQGRPYKKQSLPEETHLRYWKTHPQNPTANPTPPQHPVP